VLIFLLWRVLCAVAAGFVMMIATAAVSAAAGWSLAHGGFIFVWPFFSAFAFFGLLTVNLSELRERMQIRRPHD
jgi:hypothetical protein